jgi:hypothetical protein
MGGAAGAAGAGSSHAGGAGAATSPQRSDALPRARVQHQLCKKQLAVFTPPKIFENGLGGFLASHQKSGFTSQVSMPYEGTLPFHLCMCTAANIVSMVDSIGGPAKDNDVMQYQ